MNVFTFDLETENHTLNKRKASPFDPRNYIVQVGWSTNNAPPQEKYYTHNHREHVLPVDEIDALQQGDIINGFNIKFDLLWVWQEPCLQRALKRGVLIWCGQYAEYLMAGQVPEAQMCAMNDVAEQYGGGQKIDAVKDMWNDGKLTSQIPRDLLTDYLIGDGEEIVGDVRNTFLIFKGQMLEITQKYSAEFLTMVRNSMDGLLATTFMEYNGVHCDKQRGEELRTQQAAELQVAITELNEFLPELPPELAFNWGSSLQVSCLIFGGYVKYQKWMAHVDENKNMIYAKKDEKQPLFGGDPLPVGECIKINDTLYVLESVEGTGFEHKGKWYVMQDTYKSGLRAGEGKFKNVKVDNKDKPKGALQDQYFKFDGYTKPKDKWAGSREDAFGNPIYSTASDVIEELGKRNLPFTNALVRRTRLDKDLGTYYWKEDKAGKRKGMLTLVDDSNIIHHKINHTSTITRRLSSSDPNLQNTPRGDTSSVKEMFTSRFGHAGQVGEFDYSQLEVVVQGVLTQDKQLCTDLRDRVDFHCKRLAAKMGLDYQQVWDKCHVEEDAEFKKGRTGAKIFSFQRAYGAGLPTISEETGMPLSEVEALAEAENQLYPGIQIFDDMMAKHIDMNRYQTDLNLFINGVLFKRGQSHWDSPTGTRYTWRENESLPFMQQKGVYTSFSPTQRKNYPVQGFGGEIVQTILGKLFRWSLSHDHFDGKLLMTNTVHDCVWFDGLATLIKEHAPTITQIMESVPEVFNKAFPKTLNIDVPFPVEGEVGNNMKEMTIIKH